MESQFHISQGNVETITLFCLLTMSTVNLFEQILRIFDALLHFQLRLFYQEIIDIGKNDLSLTPSQEAKLLLFSSSIFFLLIFFLLEITTFSIFFFLLYSALFFFLNIFLFHFGFLNLNPPHLLLICQVVPF